MKKACFITAAILAVSLLSGCIVDVDSKGTSFEVSVDMGGRSVADDVNVTEMLIRAFAQDGRKLDEVALTAPPWKATLTIDPTDYGEIYFHAKATGTSYFNPLYVGEIVRTIDADAARSLAITVTKLVNITITDLDHYGTFDSDTFQVLVLDEGTNLVDMLENPAGYSGPMYNSYNPSHSGSTYSGTIGVKNPFDGIFSTPWSPSSFTSYDVYICIIKDGYTFLLKMDGENLAPLITIATGETIEDWEFSLADDCVGYTTYEWTPPPPP